MKREQEQYIRANYLKKCSRLLSEDIGVSRSAIIKFLKTNHLIIPKEIVNKWRSDSASKTRCRWTAEKDQFLRDNYLSMPVKTMSVALGFSQSVAFSRMKKLGIVVPDAIKKERRMAGLNKGRGWNKDKKQAEYMTSEMIAKTAKTRYKKGNIPHNTLNDGDLSLRSDGYVWIRIKLGVWELLHRVIYSNHHQTKLTTQDNIIFKDGNRSNFDINNLEKINNAQLMERNTFIKYPADLRAAIKALNKLKSKLKQK